MSLSLNSTMIRCLFSLISVLIVWGIPFCIHAQIADGGYTGFSQAPSAFVAPEGEFRFVFSDAIPAEFSADIESAESYAFTVGVLPRTEVGWRLISAGTDGYSNHVDTREFDGLGIRDISVNAKVQTLLQRGWIPSVAIGSQDVSGTGEFSANYVVGGYRWSGVELSIGMGSGRLSGVFWGARVPIGRYSNLFWDDDGAQQTVALEMNTANTFRRFELFSRYRVIAKGSNADTGLVAGFAYHLGKVQKQYTGRPASMVAGRYDAIRARKISDALAAVNTNLGCEGGLKKALEKLGLERVKTSSANSSAELWVTVDQRRFTNSSVDAAGLGLLAGAHLCAAKEIIGVQFLSQGMPVYWLSARSDDLLAAFATPTASPPTLAFGVGKNTNAAGAGEREHFVLADVLFSPSVGYALATEVGALDYSLALQTTVEIPLWRGAALSAVGIDDVAHSDDYKEPDGAFYRFRRRSNWLSRSIQQTIALSSYGFARFEWGRSNLFSYQGVTQDRDLFVSEAVVTPLADASLKIRTRYTLYKRRGPSLATPFDSVFNPNPVRDPLAYDAWTGSAAYYWPELNVNLDLTWGRFHFDDEGGKLTIQRFFNDTAFGLTYLRDRQGDNEALAMHISLPIGARRSLPIAGVAIGGLPSWSTSVQSTINARENIIRPNLLREGLTTRTISSRYLDRGRLSQGYFEKSWPRMRESFIDYVDQLLF